ncbi:MAG: D-alanyl-D-alanine carboxypeptidase family protein [Bacilli bacterium]|nr:D-alanyl-D-alanine carboxypeptidase family protein [Bacilli bacterium]
MIIDTKKPNIEYKKEIVITLGDEVDLLNGVVVTDNSNEDIKATIEGEYDLKKAGVYKLFYVAKDKSGNESKEEFVLKVNEKSKEKVTVSNPDSSFTTFKGFRGYTKNGLTYIDGYLVANKTYSLPSTYNPGLDSKTLQQANIMFSEAKKEGLNIYLSSGFRSYNTQKNLYNNYVARDGQASADTYSARPGHSEHQTGLAFDVNQVNSSFDNSNEAKWLSNNCYKYGFILRYPKGKTNETGYQYESWHFRYVGTDLASKLYNGGNWITMESYFGITSKYD